MQTRNYPRIIVQPGMRGCSVEVGCETLHFSDSDEDKKELAQLLFDVITDRSAAEKAYYEKYRGPDGLQPSSAIDPGRDMEQPPALAENVTGQGQGGSS